MREIRLYGSEGGGAARSPYPYQTSCRNFLDSRFRGNLKTGHSWRCPARLAGPTSPCRSRQPGAVYTIEDEAHVSLTFCQRNVSFSLISPRTLDSSAPWRLQNVESPDSRICGNDDGMRRPRPSNLSHGSQLFLPRAKRHDDEMPFMTSTKGTLFHLQSLLKPIPFLRI